MNKRTKGTLAALGLGGALAAGVAAPAAYAAVTDQARPVAAAGTTTDGAHRHGPRGGLGPELARELATRLGLPEERVRTALDELRAEHRADRAAPGAGQRPDPAERAGRANRLAGDLAARLGVEEQKVRQALDAIAAEHRQEHQARLEERLNEAVRQGRISRADADAYLRVVRSGALGPGR